LLGDMTADVIDELLGRRDSSQDVSALVVERLKSGATRFERTATEA